MTRNKPYLKMNTDCLAVVIFLLLCHLSSFINAQACVPEHPQRNFCEAAWAIKGKVIEFMDTPSNIRGDAPIERQYHIRVDRVYKKPISWNGSWKKGKKTWITTDGDMANQGVQLKEGKSYMLTGMDREGRAFMTRCNWHQRWTGVKKCHRAALQSGVFTRNCFCQISTCHGANCYQPVQRSGCVNNNNERSLDVCVFNNNLGTCDWNACGLLENKRRKAFIERRKNLALGPAYQQQKQQQAQVQQQLALQQQQQIQQQQYLQQQQQQYQQQQLLQTIQQHLQQQQAPPTTAAPSLFDMGMGGMGMGMGEGMGMGMGMGMDIL